MTAEIAARSVTPAAERCRAEQRQVRLSAGRRDRAAPEQRQLGLARAQRRLGAGQARRDRIPALLQLVKDRGFREAIGLTPPFAGPAKQVPASPQHGWPAELNPRA